MDITYKTSFTRDVKKCDPKILASLREVIVMIENLQTFKDIPNLKKLKGYHTAYRIRINNYRLCLFFDDDNLTLCHFLPRKNVYKFFP